MSVFVRHVRATILNLALSGALAVLVLLGADSRQLRGCELCIKLLEQAAVSKFKLETAGALRSKVAENIQRDAESQRQQLERREYKRRYRPIQVPRGRRQESVQYSVIPAAAQLVSSYEEGRIRVLGI
jgi:hypothetical protein